MFESINIGLPKTDMAVSPLVRAGNWIYTTQIPSDIATGRIVEGNIETQARRVFENLRHSLQRAGATLRDVVQMHVFLLDVDDFKTMDKIYREFFSAPYPTRATVIVKELIGPIRIELTVTALHDGG